MITNTTLVIVVVIFLLIIVLGGIYYWFRNRRDNTFRPKQKKGWRAFLSKKPTPHEEVKWTFDLTHIGIFIGAISALFFLFIQKPYLSLGIVLFGIGLYLLVAWFYKHMNNQSIVQFKVLSQELGIKLSVPKSKDLISFERTYPSLSGRSKLLNRNVAITTRGGDDCYTKVVMDVMHGGITLSIEPMKDSPSRSFKDKMPFGNQEEIPSFFMKFDYKTNNERNFSKWIDNRLQKYMEESMYHVNGRINVFHGRLVYEEDSFVDDNEDLRRFQKVMFILGVIAKKMEQGRR